MANIVYVGNDHVLEVFGLKDGISGVFLNAATVDVTLKDSADVNVTGQSWPLAVPYVLLSNGIYRVTLADTLVLSANEKYTAFVNANAGAGRKGYWELPVTARTRKK